MWSRRVAIVVSLVLTASLSACGDVGRSASGPDMSNIAPQLVLALSRQVLLKGNLDFDGDGKSDILWRNDDGTISIWLIDGATPKATPVVGTMSTAWRIASSGDFDGDGKSDIAWRNDDGTIAIWLMNGATPKATPVVGTMRPAWKIASSGDYDGDGKSDILWRNDDGTISIWLMDGATPKATPVVGMMSTTWKIASSGDYDGDGKSDIVWRHDDGTIAIWLMDGATPKATPVVGTMSPSWKIVSASPSTIVILSGVAATGAPITSGIVILKDAANAIVTATTDAGGNYSFDVGTKQFPVMLRITPDIPGATSLYSAATSSGTANINPLTHLAVYEGMGRTNLEDVFAKGDFTALTKGIIELV